jgi:hypothetical protein
VRACPSFGSSTDDLAPPAQGALIETETVADASSVTGLRRAFGIEPARVMQLADAYGLASGTFVDMPGFMVGPASETNCSERSSRKPPRAAWR